MLRFVGTILLATVAAVLAPKNLQAGGGCCDHCGAGGARRICQLICESKETTKVEYDCKCEEFCIPGPSERCVGCDGCDRCNVVWRPTSARIATRKVLVRNEKKETKPTYRWVVRQLCPDCSADREPQSK